MAPRESTWEPEPRRLAPDPLTDPQWRVSSVPPPTPGIWEDPDGDQWRLLLKWGRVEGRIVCVGYELDSTRGSAEGHEIPPGFQGRPKEVTSTIRRALPLSTIVEETKRSQADFLDWWARLDPERRVQLEQRAAELRAMPAGKGGRPPVYGPDHWKLVAALAIHADEMGVKPARHVANNYPGKKVSVSTASKWIRKARALGFPVNAEEASQGGLENQGDENE
jgi:hypothetical protein